MPTTLLTGSASGIGAACRAALQAQGHHVIGVDLKNADICGDLSTTAGRQAIVAQALELTQGKLDGLVLCAGLGAQVNPPSKAVSVNYFGVVDLLDGLLPSLQKGSQSAAVVVSSVASTQLPWDKNPLAEALAAGDEARAGAIVDGAGERGGNLAYAGSKNAVTVAVRQRAKAWGQAGVRLNTVAPGAVETPLLQASLKDPRYAEAIKNFVAPLGRRADPAEIAATVAFLMGGQASFVHGTQLFVDGGMDAMVRPTQF
ncbi:SDR family oxidoreductase [Comamonas faecalis]|uniref:SDR family oxidoreductase n=1 Tax=Comamonas faecalis TaxID=1387849 RepID=A0ABP7RDI7_9BURK